MTFRRPLWWLASRLEWFVRWVNRPGSQGLLSLTAAVSSALCVFWFLHVGVREQGLNVMGAWALSQSLYVFARLPEVGVAASGMRLVAAATNPRSSDAHRPFSIMAALALTSFVPTCLIVLLSGPLIFGAMSTLADSLSATLLRYLAIGGGVTAACVALNSVLSAYLDGSGAIAMRAAAQTGANVGALGPGSWLIANESFGGIGAAYVVVASLNSIAMLGCCSVLYLRQLALPAGPSVNRLVGPVVREGMTLMATGIVRLSFDPLLRLSIGLVSTLEVVALVDAAGKIATQVRIFAQALVQPLQVRAAHMFAAKPDGDVSRMRSSFGTGYKVSLLTFFCTAACGFPLSVLTGSNDVQLIAATTSTLALANCGNTAGLVSQFVLFARGQFIYLLKLQIGMAIIVAVAASCSILTGSWAYVLVGYALALAFAGPVMILKVGVLPSPAELRILLSAVSAGIVVNLAVLAFTSYPLFYIGLANIVMAALVSAGNWVIWRDRRIDGLA